MDTNEFINPFNFSLNSEFQSALESNSTLASNNMDQGVEYGVPQHTQQRNDREVLRIEEDNDGNSGIFTQTQGLPFFDNTHKHSIKAGISLLNSARPFKTNIISIPAQNQPRSQNNVTNLNLVNVCPIAAESVPHPQMQHVPTVTMNAPTLQVPQAAMAISVSVAQQVCPIKVPITPSAHTEPSPTSSKRKGPGRPPKTPPLDTSVINGTGKGRIRSNRPSATHPEHIDVHYLRYLIDNKEVCAETLDLPVDETSLCTEGRKLWKKIRRMVKNRQSAQLSRQRKREQVFKLEGNVQMHEDTIESLRSDVSRLKRALAKMRLYKALANNYTMALQELRHTHHRVPHIMEVVDVIESYRAPESSSDDSDYSGEETV